MKNKKFIAILLATVTLVNGCAALKNDYGMDVSAGTGCTDRSCTCECPYCKGEMSLEELYARLYENESEDVILRDEIKSDAQPDSETGSDSQQSQSMTEAESRDTDENSSEYSTAAVSQTTEHADELSEIEQLSDEEKAERRQRQEDYAAQRNEVYKQADSTERMTKLNRLDKKIIENNTYDFTKKNIVFIGDSITEGITSSKNAEGELQSYVYYTDMYLKFNRTLNHGVGGRMFTSYGGEELSLALNFGNVTNVDSDIIVVFAGINDYLTEVKNKRFGNPDDQLSTAGYCGALRYFMKQLKEYYSDREIFFVTNYNVARTSNTNYTDFDGQPTLKDYVDVTKKLANEFGFNVIDLYGKSFMDSTEPQTSKLYLKDALHPNDEGSRVLGEHIAAELSLYFSEKYQE